MTDRHAGYIVTLAEDIREDDAAATIAALGMVKGVLSVEPLIADAGQMIANARARGVWTQAISDAVSAVLRGESP